MPPNSAEADIPFALMHIRMGGEQRPVKTTQRNPVDRFERNANAILTEVGSIIATARIGYAKILPAGRRVGMIVNCMRFALAAGNAGTAFHFDGTAIVGKLRSIVEGDEHLLAIDVAMMADSATRR